MQTAELQLITNDAPELVRAVSTAALEPTTGERLIMGFAPFFKDAKAILDTSRNIVVTDATQVTEIKASRENRLKLRAIRIAADKTRRELKEDSMKLGNAIQSVYNLLAFDIEKEEKRLQEAEDFAARVEAARKEKLKQDRMVSLTEANGGPIDLTGYDLAAMSDAVFQTVLDATSAAKKKRDDEARAAEEARAEAIRKEAEERARIQAENARLKAEAEQRAKEQAEKDRIAAAELAKIEAARKAEQEAAAKEATRIAAEAAAERKRIQAEADAKLAAERAAAKAEADRLDSIAKAAREEAARLAKVEADRIAAEAKAKRDAAAAPDREKLTALAAAFRAVQLPQLATPEGVAKIQTVQEQREKLASWIESLASKL